MYANGKTSVCKTCAKKIIKNRAKKVCFDKIMQSFYGLGSFFAITSLMIKIWHRVRKLKKAVEPSQILVERSKSPKMFSKFSKESWYCQLATIGIRSSAVNIY